MLLATKWSGGTNAPPDDIHLLASFYGQTEAGTGIGPAGIRVATEA
jgi:hypothetical protein